ncbi:ribosome-associated translation inhibitor RaiA [bacterium]|nr:ribosome-associated translation inhibitor RaiA [bacterium]
METTFTFRNIEATDAIKDHTSQKLEKIKKFLIKPLNVHIILSIEKFRHQAEITLNADGIQHVSRQQSEDLYTSIDQAVDKLMKQVKKHKERVKAHKV